MCKVCEIYIHAYIWIDVMIIFIIRCDGIPMKCMNNEDGEILCAKCAEDIDNTTPVKAIQNIINKLE